MKLRNLYKYALFILLFLVKIISVNAQRYYPVAAKFTQLPPYPVYLADFSNPAQTNLSIQIQQRDVSIASRPIRMKVYIEGKGINVSSIDVVQGEQPIILSPNQIYTIPGTQVANYFKQNNLKISPNQYRQPFGEGTFRFGLEIIDVATSRPLSGIQWGNPVWIVINEPPVWVLPQNALKLKPIKPQNVNFQWTPRHKNVANVDYEFTITEILVNSGFKGNPQNLFLSQPPYYKTTTRSTTLNYNGTMPPLVEGRMYAYRVQAKAKKGFKNIGVFRNNGFSEIQYFTYGETLNPPTNLSLIRNKSTNHVKFNWKGDPKHNSFRINYSSTEADKASIAGKETLIHNKAKPYQEYIFKNLKPDRNYKITVTGITTSKKEAKSTIATLQSLSPEELAKQKKVFNLKGTVKWSYRVSEKSFKDNTALATATVIRRKISKLAESKSAAAEKTALEEATVYLYYSTEAIDLNIKNFEANKSKLTKVEAVRTSGTGEFKFNGIKFNLIQTKANFYIHAKYKNKAFGETIEKVKIDPKGAINQTFDDIVLLANTFRYKPRILFPSGVKENEIEEVALYRLSKVSSKNKFLAKEGDALTQATVFYNKDKYTKIGTLEDAKTFGRIFYNDLYNDALVVSIKQKEHRPVFYPLGAIKKDANSDKSVFVEESFSYKIPQVSIRGKVAKGTVKNNIPLAGIPISWQFDSYKKKASIVFDVKKVKKRIFFTTLTVSVRVPRTVFTPIPTAAIRTKSDVNGNYEFLIDPKVPSISSVGKAQKGGTRKTNRVKYEKKDITKDFYFTGEGFGVSGIILNPQGKPMGGVLIQHTTGGSIKTKQDGSFSFIIPGEATGQLIINTDGYESQVLKVESFPKKGIKNGNKKENLADWLIGIKTLKSYTESKGKLFGDTSLEEVYRLQVEEKNILIGNLYDNPKITLSDRKQAIKIRTYVLEGAKKKYLKSSINLNGNNISISTNGHVDFTATKTFTIKSAKFAGDYELKELVVKMPATLGRKDTFKVDVKLVKTIVLKGTVVDSVTKKPIEGATVTIKELKNTVKTNKKGGFEIKIAASGPNSLEVKKKKYTLASEVIKYSASNLPKKKVISLKALDKNIPEIKTLLGFKIEVSKAEKKGSDTYQINGKLEIPTGGIYVPAKKGDNFSFDGIMVKVEDGETNATLVEDDVDLEETSLEAILFEYAEVELEGSQAGDAKHFKLMPISDDNAKGKITIASIGLNEDKIMGMATAGNFGDIGLVPKKPGEKAKVTLNSNVSKKNQKKINAQNKIDKKGKKEAAKEDDGKEETAEEEDDEQYPVFTAENTKIEFLSNSTAFKVEFGSSTRIKTTKKPKEGKSDEKKKRRLTTTKDNSETHFPFTVGLGNVPMGTIEAERESAELNGDGMTMQGFFTFPLMKKFGVVKKPIIDVLEIAGKDFDMKKVSFKRGDGKAFTTFNAAGKYKLVVKSLEIHENFRGFGLGGLMFTDKKNHFIVNSFNVIKYKSLKYPVPGMEMSFTKAGYRVKDLRLKSPEDQTIKFGYNKGDAAYEVDGGLIMELQKGKGGSLAKKLFPLTAQRFIISTSGKFFVALKADLKLKIGPITINAKKILFNKGASMTWAEMTTYLTKSQKEIDKFSKTSKFNNANAKAIGTDKNKGKRDSKMAAVNAMEVSYDNPEPELDEEDVKWAFGFSGGIQFASIKGMGAKVDAGFLLGDKGKGFEIQFNEIDILVESTAFKASATVKIVNTPEKTGMEGVAELVTVKKRFKAKLKFYKLQGGIEFGVGFVGAAMIPLGAPPAGPIIICSALGGEVDFNTKDHKFMVRLEGAAFAPGTVPEVSEFRNIALQVEFNGKKCGVWPVITGTTDWYLKGEKWCGAKIVLDFCKQSVLLDVECRQEIIKGAMAQIKATIFCSIPNKSIFMGASIRTELFMLKLNGSLQLGVNNNFSLSPPDVKHYKGFLPDFMLNKGTTLNGIYVGVETTAKASSSGKVGIWKFSAAYSADAYAKAKFQLGYNFTTTNFVAEALVKGGIKAKLSVSKYSLNGNGKLLLTLKGGYNNSLSWHCNGKALVDMSVYNSGGNSLRCNSAKVNWKSREQTYPCGLKCCCGRWSWPRKPRCRTKYCSKSISYPSGFAFKGCFKFDKSFKYQSK